MLKINDEITQFANEIIKYFWPIDVAIAHQPEIQASMKNHGIKDFKFDLMDNIPAPMGRITTYRLKTVTLDGLAHFYIVSAGNKGAFAMDEYDLIAQGWGWKKVKIDQTQYNLRTEEGAGEI